jgi:L-seryl-tRNA(Ser) seleniumtransferase
MIDAVPYYVEVPELSRKAGEVIARVTGAEAGLIVSGASAGEALMAAACLTGADEAKAAKLPDTTGLKDEIIIMRCHRNRYDGAFRLPGARFVEVGTASATPPWELEGAITENTAAVAYVIAPFFRYPLSLRQVVEIAHKHDVPVIVDAAAEVPPAGNMKAFIAEGADMVTFSGGKGIRGPQSTGILCGRKDLIAAAELHSLNYYSPHAGICRPMKVCKEEVVALIAALELFERTDHEAQWAAWRKQSEVIVDALQSIPGLDVRLEDGDPNRQGPPAVIYFLPNWQGPSAESVQEALKQGDPPIYIGRGGYKGELWITPVTLQPGEEEIVAHRLKEELTGKQS